VASWTSSLKKPFAAVLENRAAALKPGESGLLALDWWNGNRSILVDVDLTGVLLGMTLATRAEEIYRALIEATAFGTRTIVEAFDSKGIKVEHLVACGGLPEKNQLLMQIYADVTGRDINLKIQDLVSQNDPKQNRKLFLQPLGRVYLHSDMLMEEHEAEENSEMIAGSIHNLRLLVAAAVILLMIACVNYANLSTAAAGRRAKEVGVRKACGAQQKDLDQRGIHGLHPGPFYLMAPVVVPSVQRVHVFIVARAGRPVKYAKLKHACTVYCRHTSG
jgi:hypothetical protein